MVRKYHSTWPRPSDMAWMMMMDGLGSAELI
jgi:hypothetical protein